MYERKCLECGAAFTTRYARQVVCSEACRVARKCCADAIRASRPGYFDEMYFKACVRLKRREAARRRAEFFAARDAAYARAGLPAPKIAIKDGGRIEYRGRCVGGCGPARILHCY